MNERKRVTVGWARVGGKKKVEKTTPTTDEAHFEPQPLSKKKRSKVVRFICTLHPFEQG
jgi:hypothetical protein